jgi:hypothetical protein
MCVYKVYDEQLGAIVSSLEEVWRRSIEEVWRSKQ